jgi:hypothetical protein
MISTYLVLKFLSDYQELIEMDGRKHIIYMLRFLLPPLTNIRWLKTRLVFHNILRYGSEQNMYLKSAATRGHCARQTAQAQRDVEAQQGTGPSGDEGKAFNHFFNSIVPRELSPPSSSNHGRDSPPSVTLRKLYPKFQTAVLDT